MIAPDLPGYGQTTPQAATDEPSVDYAAGLIEALVGDAGTYARTQAVFHGYITSVETGNSAAIGTMVDFWFGDGTFDRMPEAMTAGLRQAAPANARDVRATFRETYAAGAFRRLPMPVVTVVGDRSPDITRRIATAIATHAPRGSVTLLAKANHAMTTTHADAVADIIASCVTGR